MVKGIYAVEDNVVFWEYKSLCLLGVCGFSPVSLRELSLHYDQGGHPFEVASLIKKGYAEFLAGFCCEPPLTLRMGKSGDIAFIVTAGLERKRVKDLTEDLVSDIQISPLEPPEDFIHDLASGGGEIGAVYDRALRSSQKTGFKTEQVFGALSFYHFLTAYQRWDQEEAMKWTLAVFKLPEDFTFSS